MRKIKFIAIVTLLLTLGNLELKTCEKKDNLNKRIKVFQNFPFFFLSKWGFPQSVEVSNYNPDCQPFISSDGKKLFFISTVINGPPRPGHIGNWDIYQSSWNSVKNQWGKPVNLGSNVNSRFSERRPTLSPDNKTLYFSSNRPGGYGRSDIYFSIWNGSEWAPAQNLGPIVNTQYNESESFLSFDGQKLYFESDRPGGYGSSDIWVTSWNGSSWDPPINLGPPINTDGIESRPSITADGKKLYFMSSTRDGYGNMDLWVSTWNGSSWDPPVNVGAPINTDLPACTAYETPGGDKLYIGSEVSEGSRGDEDIWVANLSSKKSNPSQTNPSAQDKKIWEKTGELKGVIGVHCLIESFNGALYAGTYPYGDVFKSIDKGKTWTKTANLSGAMRVYSLLQASDGTIYAGTYPYGDVFKTNDGGRTWKNTADLPGATAVRALIQTMDGTIYAGVSPNFGLFGRVFKTNNGGISWQRAGNIMGITGGIFCFLQANDGSLYAGGWSGRDRVFRSTDGGMTWIETGDLFPIGDHMSSINSLVQTSDGTIYATGWIHGYGGYVFKTENGGLNWNMTGEIKAGQVHAVRVYTLLEASDGTLYIGFQPGPDYIIYKSTNKGKTWEKAGTLTGAREVLCLLQASDGYIYAGTTPTGEIFKSKIKKSKGRR